MKKSWRSMTIVALLLVFVAGPVLASGDAPPASPITHAPQARARAIDQMDLDSAKPLPPGEVVLADALIVRPFGLAACVIGLVGSIFTIPWAATSHSQDVVGKTLIEAPFEDTFRRPLGKFDLEP